MAVRRRAISEFIEMLEDIGTMPRVELKPEPKKTEELARWKIPCSWRVWGIITVEAHNKEEAIELAGEATLPGGKYVDGSFELDEYSIDEYNDPPEHIDTIFDNDVEEKKK